VRVSARAGLANEPCEGLLDHVLGLGGPSSVGDSEPEQLTLVTLERVEDGSFDRGLPHAHALDERRLSRFSQRLRHDQYDARCLRSSHPRWIPNEPGGLGSRSIRRPETPCIRESLNACPHRDSPRVAGMVIADVARMAGRERGARRWVTEAGLA